MDFAARPSRPSRDKRSRLREAAGAAETAAVLTPICVALRREPSAVIHTDTGRGL